MKHSVFTFQFKLFLQTYSDSSLAQFFIHSLLPELSLPDSSKYNVCVFVCVQSKEELQLMPQTVEEHLDEMEDSDSDSCSTHSADSQHEPDHDTADCVAEVSTQAVSLYTWCS